MGKPDVLYSNDVKPRTNTVNAGQWHTMLMILSERRFAHDGTVYSVFPRGTPGVTDDCDMERVSSRCGVDERMVLPHSEVRNNGTSTSSKWHALTYVKSKRRSSARISSRVARSLGCTIWSASGGFKIPPPNDFRMVSSATRPRDRVRHSRNL